MWTATYPDVDIEHDAFVVDQRRTVEGDLHFVVNMPLPSGSPNEAHFFGICVPRRIVHNLDSDEVGTQGVRLVYLESSILGLCVVGESCGPADHINHGSGPEPSRDGMWSVMGNLCSVMYE